MTKRSNFTGKLGFVLAAAGSAVGLGNIWRFPYLAAKYGGGIFLLVYLILAVTFGFALMTAEVAIGRKTGLSAISAFKALDRRYAFVGWLASLVPVIILPYYSVIGGWVIKYFGAFISGSVVATSSDTYFTDFITNKLSPIIVERPPNINIEHIKPYIIFLFPILILSFIIFKYTHPGKK